MEKKKLLIIGGGITGLTAAYDVSRKIGEKGWPIELAVADASPRFGGAICTEKKDGLLIEHGPDSFATDKPHALQLCRELGLENELIGVTPESRRIYLRWNQQLYPIPQDFHLMAPARFKTLLEMGFLSWSGKIRMAAEYFIPAQKDQKDESLGGFMERRFGTQVLERIGQPFLGSIFGCDIRQLSLKATFPRFREMELTHGSVIRGLRAMKKKMPAPEKSSGAKPLGMFVTLKQGMSDLVESLQKKTQAEWISQARIKGIQPGEMSRVFFEDGRVIEADYLCLALPAFQVARFFEHTDSDFYKILQSQNAKSMFVVHASFHEKEVKHMPSGSGFVGTADTRNKIQGASFVSQKFKGRAPEGIRLFRIFAGYPWHQSFEQLGDQKIGKIISEEFCRFFDISGEPLSVTVSRYVNTMPQYSIGHSEWLQSIEGHLKKYPRLFLAGNSYQGAGVPDCVRSARETAQKMIQSMGADLNAAAGVSV